MYSSFAIDVQNVSKHFVKTSDPSLVLKSALFEKMGYDLQIEYFNALKNINLSIREGESVGIIGKNGSGKSTLLQLITGTMLPTSGNISVKGRVSALLELGSGFNPDFTGYENIRLNAALLGISENEIDKRFEKIVEFADIGDRLQDPIKTYSSGMIMRLAFAVQVQLDPEILIVDEALAVGDIFFQQKCFKYMREDLANITKLFVTHDLGSLTNLADRVIVMSDGEIIFDGIPHEAIKVYREQDQKIRLFKRVEHTPKLEENLDNTHILENLKDVPEDLITGTKDISITHVGILQDGRKVDIVSPGDDVEILAFGKCSVDEETNLVTGFFFSDKTAQDIFGYNTIIGEQQLFSVKSGRIKFKMKFKWPNVKNGEYTLTIGVGKVSPDDINAHEVKCWVNNIITIVSGKKFPHNSLFTLDLVEDVFENVT